MRGKQGTDAGLCVKLAGQNRVTSSVTSTRHSVTGPCHKTCPVHTRYKRDSYAVYLDILILSIILPFLFQSSGCLVHTLKRNVVVDLTVLIPF